MTKPTFKDKVRLVTLLTTITNSIRQRQPALLPAWNQFSADAAIGAIFRASVGDEEIEKLLKKITQVSEPLTN